MLISKTAVLLNNWHTSRAPTAKISSPVKRTFTSLSRHMSELEATIWSIRGSVNGGRSESMTDVITWRATLVKSRLHRNAYLLKLRDVPGRRRPPQHCPAPQTSTTLSKRQHNPDTAVSISADCFSPVSFLSTPGHLNTRSPQPWTQTRPNNNLSLA